MNKAICSQSETGHDSINLAVEDRYAVIRLSRPRQKNRLTKALMVELAETLSELRKREDFLVLIITGSDGIFSAGADLEEVSELNPESAYEFSRLGQKILSSISLAAPISIAAIEGYCIGGGLDVAMSCDLRYASPDALFQHPGTQRGIITGWGGTQRLPKLIGLDAARRLLMTGDRIDAVEALRLGLINGIKDNPVEYARGLAIRIAIDFTREELIGLRELLRLC